MTLPVTFANQVTPVSTVQLDTNFNALDAVKANSTDLAATTGATLVGSNDGSSGSLWTTIAGFISYLFGTNGSSRVGYDGGLVQSVLDGAKSLTDYTALRAYTGRATGVRITSTGISGFFQRSLTDVTSVDDGGTIIVDASGRRWIRLEKDRLNIKWFGAVGDGVADDTAAIQAAVTYADNSAIAGVGTSIVVVPKGSYKVTATITSIRCIRVEGEGWPIIKIAHNNSVFTLNGIPSASVFPRNKNVFHGLVFNTTGASSPAAVITLGTTSGASPTYINSSDDVEISSCVFDQITASYIIDNNRGFGLNIRSCLFTSLTVSAAVKLRQSQTEIPYWTYAVNIYSCDFTGITGKAIESDGADLTIYGGIIEGCSLGAIEIGINTAYTGAQIANFFGTYFEANQSFHVKADNNRATINFNGCKFVKGVAGSSVLTFTGSQEISFYNCSSPNQAPTITGGFIRMYGCIYMSANLGTVSSYETDRAGVYTNTPTTAVSLTPTSGQAQRLPITGGLGGGGALVMCSHSTGGGTACNAELFLVMQNVNGSGIVTQSIGRAAGSDASTYTFAVDGSGFVTVTSSAAGNANYQVISQTNQPINWLPG